MKINQCVLKLHTIVCINIDLILNFDVVFESVFTTLIYYSET